MRKLVLVLVATACIHEQETKKEELRIVSLVPSATETLLLLGAKENIVGVSNIDSSLGISVVGSMVKPNYERIVNLKPDVVLITLPLHRKVKQELERLNLKTMNVQPESIEEIYASILSLGKLVGKYERAESIVDSLRNIVDSLRSFQFPCKAFVEIWFDPLYTAGSQTFMDDYLKLLGMRNIFSDRKGYFAVPQEEVVRRNPQVILISHTKVKPPHERIFWKNVYAVRRNYVIYLDPDLFNKPGPRFTQALKQLTEKLSELLPSGKCE